MVEQDRYQRRCPHAATLPFEALADRVEKGYGVPFRTTVTSRRPLHHAAVGDSSRCLAGV